MSSINFSFDIKKYSKTNIDIRGGKIEIKIENNEVYIEYSNIYGKDVRITTIIYPHDIPIRKFTTKFKDLYLNFIVSPN